MELYLEQSHWENWIVQNVWENELLVIFNIINGYKLRDKWYWNKMKISKSLNMDLTN